MNEVRDRVRRIETMLYRHISGKPDQRASNYTTEVWHTGVGWAVEVNSMSISLYEVVAAARAAGCEEGFMVCDNGKPRLIVREVMN